MQNPNTEPNPKETVSQEEAQQQETQQQSNDNKLLSPKASVLIQPRLRAPSTRLLYSDNINPDVKWKIVDASETQEQRVRRTGSQDNRLLSESSGRRC